MQTFIALRLPPDNLLFPGRLEIDALNVTYYKGEIVGYKSTKIDRSNISSVSIDNKVLFADVIIETIDGRKNVASSFRVSDARTISGLLSNNTNLRNVGQNSMNFKANSKNYYSDYKINTFLTLTNLQLKISMTFVDTDLLDAAVFWFTNVERKKHSLKQFHFHDRLRQAATLHSNQMKRFNFFAHENPFNTKYKTLTDRIDAMKDNNFQGFMSWGENIADYPAIKTNASYKIGIGNWQWNIGTTSNAKIIPYAYYEYVKIVVKGWMDSTGHRRNILNPDFEYLGCGCDMYENKGVLYFKLTQNFGGSLCN